VKAADYIEACKRLAREKEPGVEDDREIAELLRNEYFMKFLGLLYLEVETRPNKLLLIKPDDEFGLSKFQYGRGEIIGYMNALDAVSGLIERGEDEDEPETTGTAV